MWTRGAGKERISRPNGLGQWDSFQLQCVWVDTLHNGRTHDVFSFCSALSCAKDHTQRYADTDCAAPPPRPRCT